jgi:fermentation-respiration switch protein FrsA (DUF1100 family)
MRGHELSIGDAMPLAVKIIVVTAVVIAAAGALLAWTTNVLQQQLMYYPTVERVPPSAENLDAVEERVLSTPDGERVLVWYGRAKPGLPTLLYFHGNGGSLADRAERIRKYMAKGYGMFMMTYRGFGGSTGRPSERANVADANLAYDALVASGIGPEDIIIYGESLGSNVAVQVAAKRKAAGLILDAPYTSMVDLAKLHYPQIPLRWLMTDRYETLPYIGDVTIPLLIIQGGKDDIVPPAMGKAVFAAAHEPKQLAVFPEADHTEHYKYGSYDVIFRWVREVVRGKGGRDKESGTSASSH